MVVPIPSPPGARSEPDERRRVGDADVGEAVGEQEDLPDAFGALELLESLEPAAREIGLAAGLDRPEPLGVMRRDRCERNDDAYLVVVVDDREEIVGVQPAGQPLG